MTVSEWAAIAGVVIAVVGGMVTMAYQTGQDRQKNEDYVQLRSIPDLKNDLKKAQDDLAEAQATSKKIEQHLQSVYATLQSKNEQISALERSRVAFDKCAVFIRGINNEDRKIMIGTPTPFSPSSKEDRDLYIEQAQRNKEKLYSNLASANCTGN